VLTRSAPITERGSVLMLVPAGFLVLVILAALAVDSAATYLGQQQLHDSLVAATNDAVTAGLSSPSFYSNGAVVLDPNAVGRAVCLSVAAQSDTDLHAVQLSMAVNGPAVRLEGRATVDAVFGRVIPGFGHRRVRADVEAVVTGHSLGESGGTATFGPLVPLACP
jgi:hypothetical protein